MANDDSTSSGQSASRRVIDVPSTMKSSKYKPQKFGLLFGSIRFFEGLLVGRSNEDKDPYEDINAHHWIPVVDCRKFDETLGALFDFGFDVAMTAALWYDNGKAEKKRWGFPLRIAAILCFAIGGIIPFVVNLFMLIEKDSREALAWNQLSYIFFGLAAAMVSIDRFAGLTTGWIRYAKSAGRIRALLGRFESEWLELQAKICDGVDESSSDSSEVAVRKLAPFVEKLKWLINEVSREIETETNAWAMEFQGNLLRFEKDLDGKQAAIKHEVDGINGGAPKKDKKKNKNK